MGLCYRCNQYKERYCKRYSMCETCRRKIDPKQFLSRKYDHIKRRCDSKGYYIGMLKLSRKQFIQRFIEDTDFISIHREWLDSGFNRDLRPEIDRIDSSKAYVPKNIQFLTYKDHKQKTIKERKPQTYKQGREPGSGKHFLGW